MSTDLFGAPTTDHQPPVPAGPGARISNDIEEVVGVLRLALGEGYVVVDARQQPWRCLTGPGIEPATRHECDIMHQLLDTGWLTVGGTRAYQHHDGEVTGRIVQVPRSTRAWVARWDSRTRLGQPGGPR